MKTTILVCTNNRPGSNVSCGAKESYQLYLALIKAAKACNAPYSVGELQCFGECQKGPNVRIAPGGAFFHYATVDTIPEILRAAQALWDQREGA
ncbi:ferredoxin, 2Fe-2S [Magnetococcus marinus MC-1]|uniref:Ferredoxin, 2Fe-2S n=1 Tax=Magnetococcus marinus (strain ATCC BAA-1437 / JCM 17883 / MC-1) TaxID=156889 RepID=A0LA47_MAGMM|nr:(2Fe-2S) ferredoxin domain-containing protein [Magnetococcus marinus]ABK44840.1 ferredoxin, 2Fe-2S [Magnetococcus marinus MC-1]